MNNLILITVDCLRQDFQGLNSEFTFETLQKLLDQSRSFTNMVSAGASTLLAFPALFSSSYPSMFGGYTCLSENRITLAEVLKGHGYATAGIHSNPHLISQYNYNKGFSFYYDYTKSEKSRISKFIGGFRRRYKERLVQNKIMKNIIDCLSENRLLNILAQRHFSNAYDDAETINARTIQWLGNRNKRDNFFLWLHYMEPHIPYRVYDCVKRTYNNRIIDRSTVTKLFLKVKEDAKSMTDSEAEIIKYLYLTQIKYLDLQLGNFIKFLSENGYLDNTTIILTADHGGELFEHQLFGHARGPHETNRDIFLFNTVLKIPFLIYGRGITAETNDSLASSIDIAPTICNLLGVNTPKAWLGGNILSGDFERKVAVSEQVYLDNREISGAFSFQTQDEKFIYSTFDNTYQYFRLGEDPGEKKNQIEIYPKKKEGIDKLYASHKKLILETREEIPGHQDVDPETERRLRALGYI